MYSQAILHVVPVVYTDMVWWWFVRCRGIGVGGCADVFLRSVKAKDGDARCGSTLR